MKRMIVVLLFLVASQLLHGQTAATADDIKVLFAYTKKAAIEAGGPAELKRSTVEGLKLLNEALDNSRIGYNAVAIKDFVEVDSSDEPKDIDEVRKLLADLRNPDGNYCKVHNFRQQLKGDIVCLIFSGYTMGLADTFNGAIRPGEFMVCNFESFGGSYVFPHEFGHNLGAQHAPDRSYNWTYGGENYRTVSNNGGVSIPYFAEDRTIQIELEGKMRTVKLGDARFNSVKTMQQVAPLAANLGEGLKEVTTPCSGLAARLVDPADTPAPPGAKPMFKVTDFKARRSGKNVDVSFSYECSRKFAEKADAEGLAIRLVPFTPDGKEDPFNGSTLYSFNPGTQTEAKVFDGHPTYPVKEMKPGSYFELQYVTWNKDGTTSLLKVAKRVYITDTDVRIEDVGGMDPPWPNGTEPVVLKPTKPVPDVKVPVVKDPVVKVPVVKPTKTNPPSTSGAEDLPVQVALYMENSAGESYRVTLERDGKLIGEYFLAGDNDRWTKGFAASNKTISDPPGVSKYLNWRTMTSASQITRNGVRKDTLFQRTRTGCRYGDVLKANKIGDTEVKSWVIDATKAGPVWDQRKLPSGEVISIRRMGFNPESGVWPMSK